MHENNGLSFSLLKAPLNGTRAAEGDNLNVSSGL